MITTYLAPIDSRSQEILCAFHAAGRAEAAVACDWNAYMRHTLRAVELRFVTTGERVALDREEFELIESRLPA